MSDKKLYKSNRKAHLHWEDIICRRATIVEDRLGRDDADDTQVICDVLQSGGIIGGPYKEHNHSVELIFCNPDLIWRNEFERPRIGQGGFRVAFQAVYKVGLERLRITGLAHSQ